MGRAQRTRKPRAGPSLRGPDRRSLELVREQMTDLPARQLRRRAIPLSTALPNLDPASKRPPPRECRDRPVWCRVPGCDPANQENAATQPALSRVDESAPQPDLWLKRQQKRLALVSSWRSHPIRGALGPIDNQSERNRAPGSDARYGISEAKVCSVQNLEFTRINGGSRFDGQTITPDTNLDGIRADPDRVLKNGSFD